MKIQSSIYFIIFSTLIFPFINSCDKGGNVPSIAITGVTNITGTTATIGVNIVNDGGADIAYKGVCWGLNPNPSIEGSYITNGSGIGNYSSSLSNLLPDRIYYVRAYALNREGIAYSPQVSFETLLTDYEGNTYHKITIGTQVWMVENLRTQFYRNGDPVPNIASGSVWANGIEGACCSYNNEDTNKEIYGILYNAYAVLDSRNLAPVGWHIATNDDYLTLETFLGGNTVAGGKIKEAGITHWISPNTGADNSSGFTALPGGYREGTTGSFSSISDHAYFWTTTAQASDALYGRILATDNAQSTTTWAYKQVGMSVRCVKN